MLYGSSPIPSTSLGRRSLLKGIGGIGTLAGLGALSGCTGAEARDSDDIAFWHLLGGPDGVTMGEMLGEYMATDGAADVTQTVLHGSAYYTKLSMGSAGGRG